MSQRLKAVTSRTLGEVYATKPGKRYAAKIGSGNAAETGKNICRTFWTAFYIGEAFVPQILDGTNWILCRKYWTKLDWDFDR